jgi:transposase
MAAFTTRERRRIVDLYRRGLDTDEVAEAMAASLAGVRRVRQQFREEGRDHAAFDRCGRKPALGDAAQAKLRELARARPDAFCRELADALHAAVGVRLTRQSVGRWLARLGLTRKNSRATRASRRAPT